MPVDLYAWNADGIISNTSRPNKNPPHNNVKPTLDLPNSLATNQAIPAPKLTLKNRSPPRTKVLNCYHSPI